LFFVLALACVQTVRADDAASEDFFEKRVRPILAGTCFRCHGGQKVGGGLRVDSREALIKGGESGPAIDSQALDRSLILGAISRNDDVSAMPPDEPLTARQVLDLTAWIKAGAPWPAQVAKFESEQHWAFQPLRQGSVPKVEDVYWPRTSIDPYILAALEGVGRKPSPAADRRTLLRRITYDLTGLPPTPEDVAAFAGDESPQAYAKVVERLLASPAYGEHWGRHWLDVVRYADTAGENSDHPLPHAWRYRNWVIEAFNRDLPYDQFLREQIAGDIIAQQGPAELAEARIIATGYLAIARRFGHEIEKDMHLTFEDTLDTLGKSVLGLSIGCCRCHDHKFDPLSTQDYYGLYGIFESTRFPFPGCEPQQQPRDLVALPLTEKAAAQAAGIDAQLAAIDAQQAASEAESASATRVWAEELASKSQLLSRGEIDDGKEATLVDLQGEALDKLAIRRGEILLLSIGPRDNHGADSTLVEFEIAEVGGQSRQWSVRQLVDELLAGNPHADRQGNAGVWYFLDLQAEPRLLVESLSEISGRQELQAWRNGDTPSVFVNRSEQPVKVWTDLPPRSFFMHPGPQGPVALAWVSPVEGEIAIRGRIADAHPSGPNGVSWKLEQIASVKIAESLVTLGKARAKLAELVRHKAELAAARPETRWAYAVSEGVAHDAHIHNRGEPEDLGELAPRKFLDALGGYKLTNSQASGRLELAQWLTDKSNPLTPRVMVNRVWQWHFGRGLVSTPNDFGSRGVPPTHPELLDHLASEFVNSGWSLKALHRRIVLSATYQQSAGEGESVALYGAFQRRRLSAEELRDTLLVAGGDLDPTPGGPHPFPPESSWNFTQHAPFATEYYTTKRSVYVMQKRNRRHPFFAMFDGANPNASTAVRDVTTVPTQALFFLNAPLIHAQASKLAGRAMASVPKDDSRLDFVYLQLLGRRATEDEQRDAAAFLHEYAQTLSDLPAAERAALAWQAYARVLLSSNEVCHVD
jgi:hypothetical protein